jgi:type IV pilus assembly protein PilY1
VKQSQVHQLPRPSAHLLAMLSLGLACSVTVIVNIAAAPDEHLTLDERSTAAAAAAQLTDAAARMCFSHPGHPAVSDGVLEHSAQSLLGAASENSLFLFQPDGGGSFKKFAATIDAGGQLHIGTPLWDAGAILTGNASDAPQPAAALRNIYTQKRSADQSSGTIAFKWNALTQQQRDALSRASPTSVADGQGERRLDFLRGERSFEIGQPGGIFRRRNALLENTANSAALQVGAPSKAIAGPDYSLFFANHARRYPVLYLGANDGMLHAFDAGDGHELFAYVPALLLPFVSELSNPAYVRRPYVDGATSAAEASVNGAWKTVLLAGLGGGARGLFALDVSDPDQFERGNGALWEFGSDDDADIGYVMAAPLIAKFRTGTVRGVAVYRYFAVLSGGLNPLAVPQGARTLFLLALDKSPSSSWKLGVNYYKLNTPISTSAGAAGNTLGPPALALGADGAVRYAYAGDVQGNLWRFDFSGGWSAASAASAASAVSPGARAITTLFMARDAAGVRQPITQRPSVVFALGGGYMVLFGTGKLTDVADSDAANFKPQSFYAIHDAEGTTRMVSGRGALAARTLSGSRDDVAGFSIASVDPGTAGLAAPSGWYLDFPYSASNGERSISSAVLAGGKVFFNTILPGSAPCTVVGVRTYAIDALSGLAFDASGVPHSGIVSGQLSAGMIGGAPLLLATATDVGPRNSTGGALVSTRYHILSSGKTDHALDSVVVSMPAKRISWREIPNWPELHEAASHE